MGGSEDLRGIVYASQARVSFDPHSLEELESHAASRNAELGVTGYLFFEEGHFLQYIEGEHQTVTNLMSRIEADPRHTVLNVLSGDSQPERRFPAWSMKWLSRRDFYRLESLLLDHLRISKNLVTPFGDDNRTAWDLVDRVCGLQNRLVNRAG